MIKASALYIVIVMALVMAVICSSVITAAYFYKLQYQKTFRRHQLEANARSAVNILLESKLDFTSTQKISLFNQPDDTVLVRKGNWGVFEIGSVRTFMQRDTIDKAFSMAAGIDSAKWSALYIIDEDRNISVSGKTTVRGTAYLPKAGIKEAYVNNHAYDGDKRLVVGTKKASKRELPELDDKVLKSIQYEFSSEENAPQDSLLIRLDSVEQSFLKRTLEIDFKKKRYTISNQLRGNIIIRSDTLLTIGAAARLENVLVFAKAIKVEAGFKGKCQLFALDSISVGDGCHFSYPSALCVTSLEETNNGQRKIYLGRGTEVNGTIVTYEKKKSNLPPVLELGKEVKINGQVYCNGLLNYQDDVVITGSVHTNRFLYQTSFTRYENYLINLRIDGPALSKYYLGNRLIPVVTAHKRILQWLK